MDIYIYILLVLTNKSKASTQYPFLSDHGFHPSFAFAYIIHSANDVCLILPSYSCILIMITKTKFYKCIKTKLKPMISHFVCRHISLKIMKFSLPDRLMLQLRQLATHHMKEVSHLIFEY